MKTEEPSIPTDGRYIDLKEVAKRLSMSPRTVRARIADINNPLPAFKLHGSLRFSWPEIESWMESHRVKPPDVSDMIDELLNKINGEDTCTR